MTKKIITLLLVVSILIANVFAGGFAGINAGPSFDIYTLKPEGTSERSDTYVDNGVAIDLYGAFFFGEKENIGLSNSEQMRISLQDMMGMMFPMTLLKQISLRL